MDGEEGYPVDPPLADARPDYPQCPHCGNEFMPGHCCREGMVEEIERIRAAFQISVTALCRIRNMLLIWRRGEETARLREVSAVARTAIHQIEELIGKGSSE